MTNCRRIRTMDVASFIVSFIQDWFVQRVVSDRLSLNDGNKLSFCLA
jgi:hypothetical protein